MGGPLRGGGVVKGRPLTFFLNLLPFKNRNYFTLDKFLWPLSPREGGMALMARPFREEIFFVASLIQKHSPFSKMYVVFVFGGVKL